MIKLSIRLQLHFNERSVFLFFVFFNTSFRDNRTPGTTQRYERYVKESPRTAGTWDRLRGTGWRPLPPKGGSSIAA